MDTTAKKILPVTLGLLIIAVTAGGLVKWTMFAIGAATGGTAVANISPFEIMLKTDVKKLPLDEIKDGECSGRC